MPEMKPLPLPDPGLISVRRGYGTARGPAILSHQQPSLMRRSGGQAIAKPFVSPPLPPFSNLLPRLSSLLPPPSQPSLWSESRTLGLTSEPPQALEAELNAALGSCELRPLAMTYTQETQPPTVPAAMPQDVAAAAEANTCRALVLAGPQRRIIVEEEPRPPLLALPAPPVADGEEAREREGEDNLSDIDDDELDKYINSREEAELKVRRRCSSGDWCVGGEEAPEMTGAAPQGLIWEQINKDYLEKQEAKAAAIAAAEQVGTGARGLKP